MERIAKFEKVSLNQFKKDFEETFNYFDNDIYESIKMPVRATAGSAGYDFYSPIDFTLKEHETIKIPTSIKASINIGWVLKIYPRSSLGFKYQLVLNNTVGIIDSDYYNNKSNEGHIFIKITNMSNKTLEIKKGEAFAQGLFEMFGITIDDDCNNTRSGGIGSTNK